MATVIVTNLSSIDSFLVADVYTTLAPGAALSFYRRPSEIDSLSSLIDAVYAGSVSVSIVYTPAELAWLGSVVGTAAKLQRQLGAQDRDDVSFGDWSVTVAAELNADAITTALTVHRFDSLVEEGAGLGEYWIPVGAATLTLMFEHRPNTAVAGTFSPRLYKRSHAAGAAYSVWTSLALTGLVVPASTVWQQSQQTITLATLGLVAGDMVQFELTRVPGGPATDWTVGMVVVRFD